MPDAEAGRQALYLLEVALPLEFPKVAQVGGRFPKRTALREKEGGKEGRKIGEWEKERGRERGMEKEGTNRSHLFSFLGSSS